MATDREERDWKRLQGVYKYQGLVLALGAGLSFGSGIPTWIGLLERLGHACDPQYGKAMVGKLQTAGYSHPAIASALKALYSSTETHSSEKDLNKNFLNLVRQSLYQEFEYRDTEINEGNYKDFVKDTQNNRTLAAVARLCVAPEAGDGPYRRNPRIHAVVNFNLDSIFREYIHANFGGPQWPLRHPIVRTIERPTESSDLEKISVYHMHGYLRFDSKQNNPSKEADTLVFTEQEFFDFFNRPTSVFTYTFLTLLRDHRCLFVGLSMQDDNIRRLLHYSTTERKLAHIEKGDCDRRASRKAVRHFAILKHDGDRQLDAMRERLLRRLGTRVLWVDDYPAIADRLEELRRVRVGDDNALV